MVQSGSNPAPPLSLVLGTTLTLVGIGAMVYAPALVSPAVVGFRGFLAICEALLPLPALLYLAASGAPVWRTLALAPLRWSAVAWCALLGAALWLASLGLLELQNTVWPVPPEYIAAFRRIHDLLYPRDAKDALVSLAAIALIPAACEEAATRGVLLPSLRTALSPPMSIGLSAAVFALMHLDPYRTLFTFSVGLALGAVRLRTQSLWPSLIAHASLNALTFAAAPFLDDPNQPLPDPQPLLGLALLAAGSWATMLLWRRLPVSR